MPKHYKGKKGKARKKALKEHKIAMKGKKKGKKKSSKRRRTYA